MKSSKCACVGGHTNRRDFMRVGTLTFLGINLTQFLQVRQAMAASGLVEAGRATACLKVWLDGGPSQMDTWDPKPNSSFKPISTNVAGIQISELFPRLAKHMDKLSIIRSMHTEENNHGEASHYHATGHRPNSAMKFPSFCSVIANELGSRNHVPPHVIIPSMPKGKIFDDHFRGQIISPEFDPMLVPDLNKGKNAGTSNNNKMVDFGVPDLSLPKSLTRERVLGRRAFLNVVDRHYRQKVELAEFAQADSMTEQAWNMILSPEVRKAFDLGLEPDKVKEAYGKDAIGQGMLLARRLVEAGSRFVTAAGYKAQDWDTHSNNDKKMKEDLGPTLDRSLTALIEDLVERGLWDSTMLMVTGDFGRTYDYNEALGRDHWPECWSILIGGGGIKGGQVVGSSDSRGGYVAERMVTMGDLFATLYKAMGIDWTKEYMHPIGRPVKIANTPGDQTGVPISELI